MDILNYFWEGDIVRLRPLKVEDAEQSYANSLDSHTRQVLQLGVELPTSIAQERAVMEKYSGCKDVNGVIIFGIETIQEESVGGISLHSRNKKNGTFSFGISVRKGFRQKGYANEAARILFRYCFYERRFQKCNSACVEGNTGSIKLHESLGFAEEGRRRRQFYMNGRFYDDILFGLTREEFDKNEAGQERKV